MKKKVTRRILITTISMILLISLTFSSGISAAASEAVKYQKATYQQYIYNKTETFGSLNMSVSNPGLYNTVYNGLLSKYASIDVSAYTLNVDDAVNAYFQCLDDHPEIFYADVSVYVVYTSTYVKLNISYLFSGQTLENEINNFNSKVNSILASVITPGMTPIQKELEIHDYILKNSTYDHNDLNYPGGYNPLSHSTYGIIVNGLGVCQSYSRAMKLLLNKAGIECGIVLSDSMNHAWNYVNISGKYYNLDSTWDDNVADSLGVPVYYWYFNQNNSAMSRDHQWIQSDYPASTDSAYSHLTDSSVYAVKWQRSNTDLFYIDSLYHYIYKLSFITGQTQSILPYSSKDLQTGDNKIFFVGSQNNYLYMANLDGTNVAVIDSNAGTISKVEGGFLYFKETATGKEIYISLSGNITSLDMTDTE
ncbi:MAG: transglutaminase domain-containing protein, partial [Clostridiaceae bacterium]